MGNVTTAQQSSAPSNPDVQPTVSKLMQGLQGQYASGVKVNPQSLYPGVGQTTQQGWQAQLEAARNPTYAAGMQGTMGEFGDIASGKRFGTNDPGFARLRQNAIDDTMSNINSSFNASGRFGGGSHIQSLGEGVSNAIAGLDYGNFQNDQSRQFQAAGMLPGLYQGSLAPSAAMGAVGAAQDADALAHRQAENDKFRRTHDAGWETLARSSSILGGTAPYGGTDTTKSVPWWAAGLGIGSGIAGMLG